MISDVHFPNGVGMKNKKLIFFFFIGLYLSFFLSISVFAESSEEQSKDFTPFFCEIINEDNEFLESIENDISSGKTFIESFTSVKEEYHKQVNDEFNEHIEKLSQDYYKNDGVYQKECVLWGDETSTNTLRISQSMIQRFEKYECALNEYIKNPPLNGDEITQLQAVQTLNYIVYRLETELSKSYTALELTIQMYSEMRLWYPVHRDLLCLIDQLEDYRDSLREFVDDIVRLPIKFYNYSSRNQQ